MCCPQIMEYISANLSVYKTPSVPIRKSSLPFGSFINRSAVTASPSTGATSSKTVPVRHYLDSAPALLLGLPLPSRVVLGLPLTVTTSSGWYGTWIRTTSLLLITVDTERRLTSCNSQIVSWRVCAWKEMSKLCVKQQKGESCLLGNSGYGKFVAKS